MLGVARFGFPHLVVGEDIDVLFANAVPSYVLNKLSTHLDRARR